MTNARGEDRSSYQPVTNWTGLSFGFVKATEGETITDDTFVRNAANLKAEGKPHGFYHFLHPELDPVTQAQHFVSVVKPFLAPGIMLVVDSEWLHTASGTPLTGEQVDICTRAFLDEVRSLVGTENPLIVYTNHDVGHHLVRTAAACPNLWFAYPSQTEPDAALYAPWKGYKFWQNAVRDNTDQDVYNGSPVQLSAWIKSYLPVVRHVIEWRVLKPTTLAGAARRHQTTPEEMLRLATRHNHKYGRPMTLYIERGDWNARLPMFTILFAYARVA